MTRPRESTKLLKQSSLATKKDSAHSSHTQASWKLSWMESHKDKRQSWCCHFHHKCKGTSLAQHVNPKSSIEPLRLMYWRYLHPYVHTFGETWTYTHQGKGPLSYNTRSGDTKVWTPPPPIITRSPSQPSWCYIYELNNTHNWVHPLGSWLQVPFSLEWNHTGIPQLPKGSISKH